MTYDNLILTIIKLIESFDKLEDEYGYVSLKELSDVELDLTSQGYGKLQVRQQSDFKPTALKNLLDDRLQKFLARFED